MARIRSVKPELRTDLTVGGWPMHVRYAWVLLWGYLDDHGRGRDDMRLVVADLFPLDREVTEKKVDGWLSVMASEKAGDDDEPPLCRYEVRGQRYLHAVNWTKHQRVSHPKDSALPPCPVHDDFPNESGEIPEDFGNESGEVREPFRPSRAGDEQGAGSRDKEPGTTADTTPPRVDVEKLCSVLVERMVANGCRKPTVTERWRDSARLLLDRDKVPLDEALRVLEWSQASEFWQANIHSLPTFREKFDRLRQQANRVAPPSSDAGADDWITSVNGGPRR